MQAVFSADGAYRHLLAQPGRHRCGWVMLNPSIAGSLDRRTGSVILDNTARRVRDFSASWGYDGFCVANLYDLIATKPENLWRAERPVSPQCDAYLSALCSLPLIIVAWGRNAERDRAMYATGLLRSLGCELWCLGVNDDGSPKHPLYLPHDTKLERFDGTVSKMTQ